MITLAIDASTYDGTVCLARGPDVLLARTVAMRGARSERLMPAVAAVLTETGVPVRRLDRIVCGEGPGSFTSLRIAASIAKGLAVAADRPLYAVSSLALMVAAANPPLAPGEYVAVLDALRGEAYAATCVVAEGGQVTDVGEVALVSVEGFGAGRAGHPVVGGERGIAAAPDARGIVRVSAIVDRRGAVDLRRWEPRYGRVAEAQRKWEAAHGRSLTDA